MLRENVAYKLKRGKTKEAVEVLEYLHEYVLLNYKIQLRLIIFFNYSVLSRAYNAGSLELYLSTNFVTFVSK